MNGYPVVVLSNRTNTYVLDALASLKHLRGWDPEAIVIVDDSGDAEWRERMSFTDRVVPVATAPAGYTRAMRMVWEVASRFGTHVFFLEEDFTLEQDVNLDDLAAVLDANPTVAQVALQRQPWYVNEHEHGLIGAQRRSGRTFTDRGGWLEHDSGFTGNPSLIHRRTFRTPWPSGQWTEFRMSEALRAAGRSFAYWGSEGEQHTRHNGHERATESKGY